MKKITISICLMLFSLGYSQEPADGATNPSLPQTDVISMFSNVYTNVPVDTWQTSWSAATVSDFQVAGNDMKKYTGLSFVGIETVANQLNITSMTYFNVDVWSADFPLFKVKLVDFGADAAFGGGDDKEHEITFNAPAQSQWVHLHIPLSEFENLTTREHIAQLIFVGGGATVFVDNVYFSNETTVPVVTDPVVAAPDPTVADVISLFSNAYSNVPVDTWHTSWSDATLTDTQVAGNDVKKYTGLNFVGIETVAQQLDINTMTHFNVDVWSPNFTVFKVKLVDFGADAAFGGGDDTEHEVTFDAPTQSEWVTLHIPLTDFANLMGRQHIAQLIFVGGGAKVYVDNVYFSNETTTPPVTDPLTAAPDPILPQADVMSMFSNVYDNVPVDTWQTSWSAATLEDVQVAGNDTKKYTSLGFVGIETVAQQLDINEMSHFNVDVWSPDFTVFKVKLVDFGADAAFGGGDDTEHEITFNSPAQGEWVTLHIPLSDFTNLMGRQHIAQLIFASSNAKVYVDNVYFSDEVVTPPLTDPLTAAPDPVLPQTDVISMFSNVYTNVPVDTWQTSWSAATLEDVQIAGNDTKKYTGLNFVGIETVTNQLNITDMTVFNVDVWSPDFTVFKVKLVDFGADAAFGGGDDVEHEITFNAPAQSQWISYHIPLADFENLVTREHISQLIFVGGGGKVYIDNVYFSDESVVVLPTDPTVAAPDPTMPASQVMSMFSNVYTNVPVDTWHTSWSDATLTDVQVEGNDTKKYTGLNFVGIETVAQQLDINGMEHFNVDVWSPNFTVFKVKLVDFGADGAFAGGDDTEHEITFNNLTQNDWNTLHIPLTDFTNLMGREHIAQLIFVSSGAKVYVDNVYFSTDQLGVGDNEAVIMTMYPNPATTTVQLSAQQNIDSVTVFNTIGQKVLNAAPQSMNATLDVSTLNSGIYIVNTTVNGKMASQKLIIK